MPVSSHVNLEVTQNGLNNNASHEIATEDEANFNSKALQEVGSTKDAQNERITYQTRFRVFPYLLLASIAYFLPLTASRVYETTYVLKFKAINQCLIQATLAITTLLLLIMISAIPTIRLLKVLLPVSTGIAILFQIGIAFTQSTNGLFLLHLYTSVQLATSLLASVRLSFDSGRPNGVGNDTWKAMSLGMSLAAIPTGLVVA